MSPSLQDKIDKWFLTLDGNGECPTNGCPGPDGGGGA